MLRGACTQTTPACRESRGGGLFSRAPSWVMPVLCPVPAVAGLGKQNVLPTEDVLGGQSRQRGHGHEKLHPVPCSEAAVARFVPLWGFHWGYRHHCGEERIS